MILSVSILVMTLIYCGFIFWCIKGWNKNGSQTRRSNISRQTIDVIIAIRNEERSILRLLELLSVQSYVKSNFRIVVVDDNSSDNSAGIVNDFFRKHSAINGVLFNAEGEGKKAAMAQAISSSDAELILTTDGDCLVGENWIRAMVEPFSDPEISFVAGPVLLTGGGGLISIMQRMEMIGLTGIAGASILNHRAMMCNGANLCFRKSAYDKVKGYSGSAFASGDDTQLMRKLHSENPKQLTFVKSRSALVKSHSQSSLGSFWQQRRRWATKIPFTLSFFTVFIAVISWFVHAGLL
jgi:cellulose synthase/poly-beta-1,6-N-acetylglucosamine synthase-like glycosyltransferase